MRMFSVCFGVAATLLLGSRVSIKEIGVDDKAVKVDETAEEVPAADPPSAHGGDKAVKEVTVDSKTVEVPATANSLSGDKAVKETKADDKPVEEVEVDNKTAGVLAAASPPSADEETKADDKPVEEVEVDNKTAGVLAAASPPSADEETKADDKPVEVLVVDATAVEVGEVGRKHRTYQLVGAKWGGLKKVTHPVWGEEENYCFTVTETFEYTIILTGGESQAVVGEETCIPMRETSPEVEGTPRWLARDTPVKIGWYYDSVVRDWKNADGTNSKTVTMERFVTVLTEASKFTVIGCEYLASQIVIAVFKGLRRVSTLPFQAQDTKGCFNVTTTVEYRKKSVQFGDAQVAVHQEYCVFLGGQLPGVRNLIRSLKIGTSVKLGWSHRFVHFEVGPDSAGGNVTTTSFVQRPVTVLEELPKSKGAGPDDTGAAEPPQTTKPPVIREEVKTEMTSSQYVKAEYKGTSERALNGEASVMWACFKVKKTLEYKQQDEDDDADNQVQVGKEYCARPETQEPDVRATINILTLDQKVRLGWQHDKVTRRKGSETTVSVSSTITYLVVEP